MDNDTIVALGFLFIALGFFVYHNHFVIHHHDTQRDKQHERDLAVAREFGFENSNLKPPDPDKPRKK